MISYCFDTYSEDCVSSLSCSHFVILQELSKASEVLDEYRQKTEDLESTNRQLEARVEGTTLIGLQVVTV